MDKRRARQDAEDSRIAAEFHGDSRAGNLKKLLTAIEEFLRYDAKSAAVPRRVTRALAPWLRAERRKLEKRIEKQDEWVMDFVSWNTVVWFLNHGCDWNNVWGLAAKALEVSETTVRRRYAAFKKRFHLPRGNRRLPPSMEEDVKNEYLELEDFLPPKHELDELLADYKKFFRSK